MAGGYVGSGLKDVAGFLAIIVILMVQPVGLFGEREIVKGLMRSGDFKETYADLVVRIRASSGHGPSFSS